MRWAALIVAVASIGSVAQAADDPLARARLLYNQGQFAAALNAADQARLVPMHADSADLIAGRSYLERFRASGESDDLTNARERLRRLDPHKLDPIERIEFIVGLGETLYFDGAFGAAAQIFQSVVMREDALAPEARERVLDWWATAVDRDARPRPDLERQSMYMRVRDRMRDELVVRPDSGAATYWLAAAARAQGDLQAAWDAAQAGWVRASLAADQGAMLRADLDDLVLRAVVPERAKAIGQPPEALRLEWERFKERWKKE